MAYDASPELREFTAEKKARLLLALYAGNLGLSERTLRYFLGGCYLPSKKDSVDISKKAFDILKSNKPKWVKNDKAYLNSSQLPKGLGLTIEHMVPIVYMHKYIKSQWESLSEEDLKTLIEKYFKIAIITKDENDSLNAKEFDIKDKMPRGWEPGTGAYDERYTFCRIEMHKSK